MRYPNRYKAWSALLGRWVYTYAHSPKQAKEFIRAQVLRKLGMYDSSYSVVEIPKKGGK